MGKKTVRGHDIANRFVYSLKQQPLWLLFFRLRAMGAL